MVAAHLAVERADHRTVAAQQGDEDVLHGCTTAGSRRVCGGHPLQTTSRGRRGVRRTTRRPPRAGRGRRARTPGGRSPSRSRTRCRSRRRTRLRTTAPPTAARPRSPPGGWAGRRRALSRCSTTVRLPARRPARTQRRNDSLEVSRAAAGNTVAGAARDWTGQLRRRACRGPCGGARTGSRGPRGYASAGGNRAPCGGGGCSAGTYAWSRLLLRGSRPGGLGMVRGHTRRAKPAAPGGARGRLDAARHGDGDRPTVREPLPQGQTAPPTRAAPCGQRPDLWMTSCRCPRRGVRFGPTRFPAVPHHPGYAARSVDSWSRHSPPTTALTCGDVLWTGPRTGLRAWGPTVRRTPSQAVEKYVEFRARQRRRVAAGAGVEDQPDDQPRQPTVTDEPATPTSSRPWWSVVGELQPNQRAWLEASARSRCTATRPSSRWSTSSPAASSRAGCAPRSRRV